MQMTHRPTLTPHQKAGFDRAKTMRYCDTTAMALANYVGHEARAGEYPQAAALRLVANPRQSAMVRA